MPTSSVSEQDWQTAAAMRERGLTYGQIKRRLGASGIAASASVISWHCLRLGADLPPDRRKPSNQRTQPTVRNGHLVRPYTPAEDAILRKVSADGGRIRDIRAALKAAGFDRKHNSILGRLMILARRDAREEEAATA